MEHSFVRISSSFLSLLLFRIRLTTDEIVTEEKRRIALKSQPNPHDYSFVASTLGTSSTTKNSHDITIESYITLFKNGLVINDNESFVPISDPLFQSILHQVTMGFDSKCSSFVAHIFFF